MKRRPKKWSITCFRAVHPCIPTWYLFGWRRKHLTAFLARSIQWGHLPYGRAPSTGWIWWLHSQWIVKPWVAGPVTYKSGWGYARLWIPVSGPSDSQNDHESRFAFRARVSQFTILLSKLYSISHLNWGVKIHSDMYLNIIHCLVNLYYVDQNYSIQQMLFTKRQKTDGEMCTPDSHPHFGSVRELPLWTMSSKIKISKSSRNLLAFLLQPPHKGLNFL